MALPLGPILQVPGGIEILILLVIVVVGLLVPLLLVGLGVLVLFRRGRRIDDLEERVRSLEERVD